MKVMEYNVKTNKVETDITVVTNALKNMRKEEEEKIAKAKNNENYKKIYGEKECATFEIEMWKKGIKLNKTLFTRDENGMYKEYSWE